MFNKNIKVTAENVTRLSEDFLYNILNDLSENHPIFILIDAELDRRTAIAAATLEIQQKADIAKMAEFHQCQEDIKELFEGFRGKKTLLLIDKLGSEFMEDYDVCHISFNVKSYVANANQNSEWFHDDLEAAYAKYARLLYYRIYDHYLRIASVEVSERLHKLLGV